MDCKLFIFLFLGMLINISAKSQQLPVDPKNMMKTITATSPEVAMLGRYAMQPPNYSDGAPQKNIPLYELKENGLTYPISLFYNYTGYKVKEEATSVGLGWGLTEGTIIRIVKHIPDEHLNLLKKYEDFGNNFNDEMDLGYVSSYNYCDDWDLQQNYNLTQNRLFYKLYDAQPDLYIYSFGQYNGKFLWVNNEAINLEHNDIKIEKAPYPNSQTFIITTPDGVKYSFMEADRVWFNPDSRVRPAVCPNEPPSETYDEYGYTTCWRLSEIVNNSTQAKINFSYNINITSQTKDIDQMTSFTIISTKQWGNFIPTSYVKDESYLKTFNSNYFVREITSDNFKISYITKPRVDGGEYAIDEIKVFSKQNLTQPIKTIKFTHEYFGNTSNPDNCWLKLKKVKLKGEGSNSEFQFNYVDELSSSYGSKSSLSIDHWGYYNGAGNTTLIPYSLTIQSALGSLQTPFSWANRDPVFSSARQFALEKIIYPTSGYTKINYETAQGKGIRVASLEDFDGRKSTYKYYDYHTDPNFRYIPDYNWDEYYTHDCCTNLSVNFHYVTFYGYTYGPMDFLEDSQNFYANVTENIGTPDGKGGKTEYEFQKYYGYSNKVVLIRKTDYKYGNSNFVNQEQYFYNGFSLKTTNYWLIPTMSSTGFPTDICHNDNQYRPSCCPSDPLNHYILGGFAGGTNSTDAVWIRLDSTLVIRDGVKSIKRNFYKNIEPSTGLPKHTNPIRIEEGLSNGTSKSTELYYPGEQDPDNSNNILGIPQMWNYPTYPNYCISPVIKSKVFINNRLIFKNQDIYSYDNTNNLILKTGHEEYPDGTENGKVNWSIGYDPKANITQMAKDNDIKTAIYWGFNNSLPVIKAENIDYTTLSDKVTTSLIGTGYPTLDELVNSISTFPNTSWTAFNQNLRINVGSNVLITTFSYSLSGGITSQTDSKGMITYYEYDEFQRLKSIKDQNGNIIKSYDYHYKQ